MNDKQAEFLPYHAINEFMVSDYRQKVIQSVFAGFDQLPGERRSAINALVKRHVQVPGFRNSAQAPAALKARSSASLFEKRPDYAAQILQGWSELLPDLRQKVYDFLKAREWQVLPPAADRTKLPGFLPEWPEGQNYDVLGEGFAEMFPGEAVDENDLRLMIVWLSGRLPYDMYGEDDEHDHDHDHDHEGEDEDE